MAIKIFKLAFIWILMAALCLLGLEVICRAVIYNRPYVGLAYQPHIIPMPADLRQKSPTPDKFAILGPHQPHLDQVVLLSLDNPFRVVTNGSGLRRKAEVSVQKPPDLRRVFCLGDSFTFGGYVANDHTYPSLLEQVLTTLNPGLRFEVLNAGKSGQTLRQEADLYLQRGHRCKPDLVILQVLDNDVPSYEDSSFAALSFLPETDTSTLSGKIKAWLKSNLKQIALLRVIRELKFYSMGYWGAKEREDIRNKLLTRAAQRGNLLKPKEHRTPKQTLLWTDPKFRDRLEKCKNLNEKDFSRLAKFCGQEKTPLLVVLFPTQNLIRLQRTDKNPVAAYYRQLCAKYEVDFVDLTGEFDRGDETKRLFLWPWDGHLSFEGNLLIAKSLAPMVMKYCPPLLQK
ncbi:MAG: SGNH/GDSL hydrolase family protein [Desulfarculaceae bacterium]|jgi:lysophospholipase L1-like esterase